ncbi:LPD38 domain-containing protein [Escherichia coli]|nr:phage tail tape measure protein [Escherichia coli]EES1703594.1 phage tail tape measure protein [Escherichia coli]EES2436134.1 phage tail tape measure protein [Escherichia coli]EES2658652.1 phage tail tape measure protein [Escherichia coli]EFM1299100.1 phage tail tape measure protein [Escherichia coli]
MAYSEEQRPEAQLGNQNRNSLNIQQPGETDSYEAFFSDSNRWKDNSTSFSLGDVLPTMGKGFARSVRGTGEMARGLGDAMIQSPVKTGARILNEFSRMGLPGVATVQDIFAGGSRGADEVIDTLPDGKNAVTDTVGKGLKVTGKAVSDGAKSSDEWLTSKMSPGALRALNTPMTEGYDDSAVWVAKGVNLIGALVPDMVAGGVAKKVGDVTLRKTLTAGLEKKYIAAGMQPERATALAAEAVDKKMPDLFQAGLITHSTASAQGQSAMAAADAVLNADYSELAQSPKFQQTFLSIDADPQHAQLTDRQKMDLAKERVADEVRAQLATDPQLLAVNAMAAKLGDAQLLNLAMRGTAKTVKSGIVRNATAQGAINAAQGGYSRYQENTALRETAGMDVSPWEGVADATIEGAALGAVMGAPFGAVAGYRGRRQAAEETAMRDAETVQQDDAAPQPESVDPVAQHRESMQGMNREQLLEQYADADMATEGDASATHRREAASQLLNELDEQAKRQAVMNELKAKPRSELLEEYRRLSQKEGRTETEEQQFQAIREVIRPQQEVTPEAQSQPENAEDGNGSIYPTVRFRDPNEVRIEINGNGASRPAERIEKVRPDNRYFTDEKSAMGSDVFRNAAATGLKPSVVKKGENQYAVEMDNPAFSEDVATETINTLADGERIADADPMEQPAFMRDPRFRGFTGDDTEVQARLARGNAPTAEELVRSQMAEGDAGPTAQELTERPRLPAPGDIHPGQGYPLPGEVARTPDENQAGRGGRFTTTGEVKGQSFQKGQAPAPENAAGRQGETLEGDMVRRGLPSPDAQNATAPVREGLPAPDIARNVRMPQPESLPRTVRDSLPELAQQAEVRRQAGGNRDIPQPETIAPESETTVSTDREATVRGGEVRGKKIEDFGEEIKGAAKHRYAQLAEAMGKTLEDGEYATQPLSKLFPKPDYARLEKEGVDSDTLAMMALYRSEIPTRTSRNMQKWISIVKSGREATAGMLEGKIPAAKLADMMDSKPGLRSMSDTWKLLRTLSALQIDKASGYRVRSGVYSFVGGKRYDPPQMMYSLRDSKGRDLFFSESRDELLKKAKAYFDEQGSRERETPATSADDRITFDVYRHKASGDIFIGYGKNRQKLKGGFESARDAHDYVRTHRDELVNQVKALREVSREEQRNATNRDRTGPERRKGDVSPEQFSDAFGFRGVQFGNYVESPRRQADLNRAYDSLHDLADVLNVPTKALSLNGRLGLAFGARGKSKAAAHYEPGEVAINLTKGNGPGALAHEWFHSLDNYFGRYDVSTDGKITSGGDYMTEAQRAGRVFKDGRYVDAEYPVRQEVYDAFKGVMKAINSSDMLRRSERLDGVRSKPYWSTDVEMAARAFERYVQDKARMAGVENDYLVNIRKADDHGQPDTYAYPTNAELDGGIREAFDHLFRTLKTRETDKGVAFYSRKGVTRTPEGNLISDVNRSAEAKGSPVPQVEAVARGVMSGIKDSDLKVRVVKSQKEAEALAGELFDGYGRVHAFYRPDKREIVLVADNIPDGRTVREKLRHEIIHHAMEHVVTPAEYQTIIKTVLKTRDSDNVTIREAWRKVDASYGKESPEVQAGEFLAHMAEKQPNKFVAAWERVVALVKGVLRRTGLLKPTELNDIRLVRETIRTLGLRVREGYTPREDGAGASSQYSRSGKPDPFKVPEGEGERYRDDLARMMKSLRSGAMTANIGRTPPVLRHLGAPDLPLVISRDTVRKATNVVKHVVPMDVIERLPELMHDPDAIYRSATERNAVVMLLDAVDKNGDPVVSAVHMKATDKRIEINKVASVYGTKGGMNKANSLDKAGLTLYRKEKLSRDNPQYSGLQLPKEERSYRGSVDKILYPEDIRNGPYYSRTSSLTPEETIASRFVRQMQDKFQVLKAVQENIRKTGGKIDDSNNAYMAEELFHGKAENDLNVMKERYVQPLAKLLADYKIAQADLDEYLYARHAPERNAHIAKINPKMPDGGSGMTNAEAAEIMQRVRNSGKQAQYDRLAGIIDDMLARRRELIRQAGLEENGVVDAWQNAYRYYVPLKGQDVDGVVSLPRTGKGFTIGGRESRQAMGRASRAQSPSTQAIQDLSESLIRHRKNEVGNAFLKLVQDNPDKDYWQVFTDDRPDTMRTIAERKDQETGETIREVVERPVPMAMMADRYFTTKKNGKTYYIKLHDPRLMRAMKNMGPETSNAVIRTLGKVNRFLATVNTSYNPEFLVSNFIRDVQTAVMNLKAEQGRSDGKLKGLDNLSALAVVKDSRSAMSAVYASLRGKTLTGNGAQWQKVWKEFVEDGGKTGWFNMGDLEGQQKEMDRLVSLAKGGWKGQSIGAWNSFLNLVEDANGAVENALRLSAYKHARDAGLSRQQAASLAKNMTVNFNRRGEQGALMNSLYMFANASIQGTANLVRTLGHLNGDGPLLERLRWKNLNVPQKIALAAVGAGYLLGSLNRSVAGEDDDGVNWYDKVPSHVKERNLVIMKSVFGGKAGEYWSIPLPYGYNVFFLLGHTAEGVAAGDLTASRAAGNVVGGVLGAFSPVGSETSETLSGALLKNAAPTILRPFANLAMNENFMGAQIYQENIPFGAPKPDSQLGRRSTPEAYKAFASWLNAFSGGSQYRPGAVDITPESLKFWIDYISGGTGRFISKTTDAAVKSLNGIDIPEQQVPFLGKISGEVMPYADQQKMYDRMTEVAQYHAELKSLTGAERTAFIDENNGKLSMNGLMQDTRKRLKDLRKQRDAIYADSTLSLAQQSAMVKSVERDMKIAVDRFNREYNKKVGVE